MPVGPWQVSDSRFNTGNFYSRGGRMTTKITREQALALLKKYNQEPFHIQHACTVEAVMRWFAEELGHGDPHRSRQRRGDWRDGCGGGITVRSIRGVTLGRRGNAEGKAPPDLGK